ncbi:sensor histidine kinase [Pseudobutyrivibrio xylanivorans]|uniref:histidine kinase n=1 Tax=Pseudobutyrivibrio xylanivorans TaxID=185007 RepID=A0A1G5RZ10_PSEXY|nr:ATP-binding protein [Pseudobutyrivibrio xylanivorans]SCZ79236.1 two-component system, OmpR family, phosphate regulon sensor histidine kinase PhoR [Pseudobutyrivibrio xylanivorans]
MKIRINIRLVGIAILAIIATVIGITIIYYNLFEGQVRSDLSVSAKLLKDTKYFETVDIDVDQIDLSTDLDELRVTWIDKDGTVLYDNDASAELLQNHFDRPEIQAAFEQGEGEAVRRSDTMNEDTFYYALRLDNGTVLRVATNAQSIWAVFISAIPIILLIILLIISICIAISHLLTKQFLKPIEIMAENLENADYESPYRELDPLAEMLRTQHTDILSAAKARQDFTANVSHELMTPLTAISGYAELLEGGMVGAEKQNHFYQEIRKNADRLLALINDILRLSDLDRKDSELHFTEVDLYETVSECMEVLSVNAKQRNVTIELEGKTSIVCGNKDMLKELVENLGQNAIRYNNPNGKVKISVGTIDGQVALIVKDNGIGIPASEQQRIFERFYRVDKSRSKATGGTGLGLAIVKHIVEIHDAKIELDSAPGVGTTISVLF